MSTAAVMCGGGLGAYDLVRTLGRAGIESAVFASHPGDLAFRSRYTRRTLLLPKFKERNFQEIFDRISAFSPAPADRPVLFYLGDSELMFMSRFRDVLEPSYRFLLPLPSVLEAVMSKVRFIDLAREARFPVPAARAFSDVAELQSRFGEYKEALRRFESPRALLGFCAGLPRRPAGFIVQSYIDGPDERIASFHGYLDERSRCLACFLTREIRTNPPHAGDIAYCETFHDEALARLSVECLARIGFRGIVKIDYKWDQRARAYTMLEIEPHYQTWDLLGAYAGVNLGLIAYRHQRGEPIDAPVRYGDGVRLWHVSQDLKAYVRGYRKTKEWTLAKYVRSLRGKKHYRVYDPLDPLPFLYSSLRYVR